MATANTTHDDEPALAGVHAMVLVLGDVGVSPRMQNHALCLAQHGAHEVCCVGYQGASLKPTLEAMDNVSQCRMRVPLDGWRPSSRLLYPIFVLLKGLLLVLQLFYTCMTTMRSLDLIVVQNPPSVPTLMVVWVVSWLRGSRVVLDWHNYGYTLLAMNLRPDHWMVRLYRYLEFSYGANGSWKHLCVTHAMKEDLHTRTQGQVEAVVLYDRAPAHFGRSDAATAHTLFAHLHNELKSQLGASGMETLGWGVDDDGEDGEDGEEVVRMESTLMTEMVQGEARARWREDRVQLVVSSTSWTPDEDFGILLEAICRLDEMIDVQELHCAPILFVITGKGPQKQMYVERISKLSLNHCAIATLFLRTEDYPRLLGCADLGVCLHTSSSGLDLPMKVVDMFACGVPVCAKEYACLDELVEDGTNGLTFNSAEELSEQFVQLLASNPGQSASSRMGQVQLDTLARGVVSFRDLTWEQHWQEEALGVMVA